MKKIPSLKGFPQQIKPTLKAIGQYQDLPYPLNRKRIKEYLSQELPKLSPSKSPDLENLISAQAIPTCERLGLITKDRKRRRLTFLGRKLNNAKNNKEFDLILGKAVMNIDTKFAEIVKALSETQEYPGASVTYATLVGKLAEFGIDACQGLEGLTKSEKEKLRALGVSLKGSRLSDALQFYEHVGVVKVKDGKIRLFKSKVRDIVNYDIGKKVEEVPDKQFFKVLYEKYKQLAKKAPSSPYVPIIPILRELTCDQLDIGEKTFNQKLVSLPSTIERKRILLSPPMVIKAPDEIIKRGRDTFYFISIYEE